MNGQELPLTAKKKTSPWVWIGVGCGAIVALCLILVIIGGVVLHGKWKNFTAQFEDPVVRNQRVREVLGAKDLPPGYHAMMSISFLWFFDMAMLSDRELVKGDLELVKGDVRGRHRAFDKAGFIYVQTPYTKKNSKFQDYLDGKKSPDEFLKSGKVHFHKKGEIGRGVIDGVNGSKLHYTSTQGEVQIGEDWIQGITTLIAVECPGDSKFRLGIWFGPDPTAATPGGDGETSANESGTDDEEEGEEHEDGWEGGDTDEDKGAEGTKGSDEGQDGPPEGDFAIAKGPAPAVYAGSPADEKAIKDFMAYFTLCK